MGIERIDHDVCTGCRHCTEICPQDVLRFDPDRNLPVIQYLRDCQSCFLCEIECPQKAIRVTPYRERRTVPAW